MSKSIFIRPAVREDCEAIDAIYDYYVAHSTATYQLEPDGLEARYKWFDQHGPQHPVFVAEIDGHIAGWGALSKFRERAGYNHTVENSVYIHHDFHRRGIGAALLKKLIEAAKEIGHHSIIAGIDGEQQPSIELHAKFGFKRVAHLVEAGRKFDRWLDVIYMQLMLNRQ